jgi:hypothetical protein
MFIKRRKSVVTKLQLLKFLDNSKKEEEIRKRVSRT